jgi:hypothetical protein
MERPELIACDLDGTLLTPEGGISPRTAAVLARAKAAGARIVPATGRPIRGVLEVLAHPALRGLAVCSNGAVLYDYAEDRVLAASTITAQQLKAAIGAALSAVPGCTFAVDRLDPESLLPTAMLTGPDYRHAWPEPAAAETDLDDLASEPVTKLLVRHIGMTSEDLAARLAPLLDGEVGVTFSVPNGMVEIVPGGVTKSVGLARLAEAAGFPPPRTIAFGDMPNDIDMLRSADHGVAMSNAHPDVVAVADEVTASNAEDGVALVLERWF